MLFHAYLSIGGSVPIGDCFIGTQFCIVPTAFEKHKKKTDLRNPQFNFHFTWRSLNYHNFIKIDIEQTNNRSYEKA